MNRKLLFLIPLLILPIQKVFATTCIESMTCIPANPLGVFNAFDVSYGSGTTLIVFALIIGTIEIAIYLRTRSLAMLAVMGIYTIAAFSSIITSPLLSSQYHYAIYAIIIGVASVFVMVILKLVKE